MNTIKRIGLAALLPVLLMFAIVGCVAPNPQYNPQNPIVTGNEPFAPDLSSLSNRLYQAKAVNAAVPGNPYVAPVNTGLDGILGIATIVSGLVAYFKNNQAKRQQAAAASLAQTVKAGGLAPKATDNAASPAIAATIAEHLQHT